jgi:hypothetical protein
MPKHINFRVVLVSSGHGVGEEVSANADAVVDYTGQKVEFTIASK